MKPIRLLIVAMLAVLVSLVLWKVLEFRRSMPNYALAAMEGKLCAVGYQATGENGGTVRGILLDANEDWLVIGNNVYPGTPQKRFYVPIKSVRLIECDE